LVDKAMARGASKVSSDKVENFDTFKAVVNRSISLKGYTIPTPNLSIVSCTWLTAP
jgi:hypothetical protein